MSDLIDFSRKVASDGLCSAKQCLQLGYAKEKLKLNASQAVLVIVVDCGRQLVVAMIVPMNE